MSEQDVLELQQQLATANESVARLTLANAELTKQLSDADSRNKRLRRSSRQGEDSLRAQLSVAQNRRG